MKRSALLLLAIGMSFAPRAFAACSNPAGNIGDVIYNADYLTLQFCNDTDWIRMGGADADSRIGTLTNGKWCTTDGARIDCTTDAPSASDGAAGYLQFSGGSGTFLSDSTAGGQLFWDSTNHRLGIGTATPAAILQTGATLTSSTFGSLSTGQMAINDTPTSTAAGATAASLNVQVQPAPAANSSTGLIGILSDLEIPAASTVTYSNLRAIYGQARNDGSGTITVLQGGQLLAQNQSATGTVTTARGLWALTSNPSTGTITGAYGSYNLVQNLAAGAIGNAWGARGTVANLSTGTITTAYGLESDISNTNAGGTITTAYGLYLDKTNNGTITNNWGIYQSDTANNFLAGALGIGITPVSMLHVNGGIQMADDTATCPGASNVKVGTIRYNTDKIQYCAVAGWTDMAASGTGNGAATANPGYIQIAGTSNAFTDSGTTAGQQLFWDQTNHRLGIGTATPLGKLSIGNGSISDPNLPVQISTAGAGTLTYYGANNNGGYGVLFGFDNGSQVTGGVIREVDSNPLSFVVNNTTKAMTILSSGYVGIGTTAPSGTLHVVQPNAAVAGRFDFYSATNPLSMFRGNGSPSAITKALTGDQLGGLAGFGANDATGFNSGPSARIRFLSTEDQTNTSRGADIVFETVVTGAQSIAERMRLLNNGYVGIGTTSPATALDVNGTATATLFSGSGASLTSLNATNLSSGTVATARLGTGTANSTTFLRGDNTWAAPAASLPALTSGYIWVGNGSNVATGLAPTGDVTITNAGVTAIGNSKVTYAKIQNVSAANKLLGRATAGAGVVEEIGLGTGLSFSAGNLTLTESDPKISTLTNTKWCTTDGSVITCTQNAPSATAAGATGQVQFNKRSGYLRRLSHYSPYNYTYRTRRSPDSEPVPVV